MHRLAAAIVLCTGCMIAVGSRPAIAAEPPTRRISQLTDWLRAVRTHEPGESDAALYTLASWSNSQIRALWLEVETVLRFVRCARCNAATAARGLDDKPVPTRYTKSEILAIREIADAIREAPGGGNEILKRAAILHADVVMLAKPQEVHVEQPQPPAPQPLAPQPTGPGRLILQSKDGRQERVIDDAAHWDIAYALLDRVSHDGDKPAPQLDETVRLWYRATIAYLQDTARHDAMHFERALRLFPDDADIQFQNGCLHESLASPRVQAVLRSATVPHGVIIAVKSEHGELEAAERFFRRALDLDPSRQETRLRLGRVLGLLDRHEQAAAELRQVTDDVDHIAIRYYTALFLGYEEEALGHSEAARLAYERAGNMFPLAQSPQVALSHLARESGDRAHALASAQRVLDLPPNEVDRRDPFWIYHFVEGRDLDALLVALYRPFTHGKS